MGGSRSHKAGFPFFSNIVKAPEKLHQIIAQDVAPVLPDIGKLIQQTVGMMANGRKKQVQ